MATKQTNSMLKEQIENLIREGKVLENKYNQRGREIDVCARYSLVITLVGFVIAIFLFYVLVVGVS